jgi:putative redox protein
VEDLGDDSMESTIRGLGKALMIFHSPVDEVVAMENASKIFEVAGYPKSFVSLEGADHLLTSREDSLYVGSVLASWSARYLGLMQEPQAPRDLRDNRVVARTGKKGYQTEILAGGHRLMADEPIPLGGADTGPNPYDLLVGALGACTSMTLRMYADRKEWPLDSITVRLKHEKIYAEDCQQCETESGKVDSIDREIELGGVLDQDQRQRLLEIADRCPVHRTLHSEVQVTSRLKEEDSALSGNP